MYDFFEGNNGYRRGGNSDLVHKILCEIHKSSPDSPVYVDLTNPIGREPNKEVFREEVEAVTDTEILRGEYSIRSEDLAYLPIEIKEALEWITDMKYTTYNEKFFLCTIKRILEQRNTTISKIKKVICGIFKKKTCPEIPLEKFPNIKKYIKLLKEHHYRFPVQISEKTSDEIERESTQVLDACLKTIRAN